jgi:peptidyl-prolyl cis-trans isomerase D
MMEGMRKAGQSLPGKIMMALLFGLLIFSFAIWGIGDMLRNSGGSANIASVGSSEITQATFKETYQADLQALSRRARRAVTNDEARALGLEQQVLQKLLTQATLDQEVKTYGLAISDEAIAKAITSDPTFAGPDGAFDRRRFDEIIRNNGFTEASFVRQQRAFYLRQQIADTIAGGMVSPLLLRDALHRYRAELRSADLIVLGPGQVGEIADPDAATLSAYFEERKASFGAPEFRKLAVLTLTPADMAKPDSISEADARAFYAQNLGARFGTPEKREVQQIVFPSPDEAKAASERIKAGIAFADIAAERKLSGADLDLGVVTREAIIDPKVADAAFALAENSVSDPVDGRFGTVLLRVGAITPGSAKPFAEVEAEIRRELATSRARDAVRDLHETIEDQRASAKPLAEIAAEHKLALRVIDVIDRSGRDQAGQSIAGLPDREALLKAVFASDIGVDNDSLATKDGGWVWFEIQSIAPARERRLDEIRADVIADWKSDQLAGRLADKAGDAVKRLNGGATLADIAKEMNVEVQNRSGLTRQTASSGLSAATLTQIFGTKVGDAASAIGLTSVERVIFKVLSAEVPPILASSQETAQIDEQIKVALGDDVLAAYVAKLQAQMGVKVNEAMLRQAVGVN